MLIFFHIFPPPRMTCFFCHVTQAIATFLREVNKDRAESGSSPVGTSTATMFLIARKFNAERAVTLYRQYQVRIFIYIRCKVRFS